MEYTISVEVQQDFEDTVEQTIEALTAEGFGVLCDIDVGATIREKLNEPFPNYRILGACIPQLARQAIDEERQLGTLLPCNVIIYETEDTVTVSAVSPPALLSIVENESLTGIAEQVNERFNRVLKTVESTMQDAD